MKIRPMGAEFHVDRRTGITNMTKLIVVLLKFANAIKTNKFVLE